MKLSFSRKVFSVRLGAVALMCGLVLHGVGFASDRSFRRDAGAETSPADSMSERSAAQTLAGLNLAPPERARRDFALTRLRRVVPDAQVVWSPTTDGVRHVFSTSRALTAPAPGDDPPEIARRFLTDRADLFGISDEDFDTVRLVARYETTRSGVTHLIFQQEFDDVRVLGAGVRVHVLPDGSVLSASGEVCSSRALTEAAGRPTMSETEALGPALRAVGLDSIARLRAPHQVRPVFLPIARDTARRAWEFTILPTGSVDCWRVLIDAERGEVLKTYNLTWYVSKEFNTKAQRRKDAKEEKNNSSENLSLVTGHSSRSSGLVFALTPQPNLPRRGGPPQRVERETRSFEGDPTASPQGWIGSQPTTVGNNAIVQEDRDADDQGGFRPIAETLDFSFPLVLGDASQGPERFQAASVTNLFYWTNFMHDYLYGLGFDEAAGNFQQENFGRGGLGGDPIVADAQDGSRLNNASFATSEDGFPGRMSMFLWTRANPSLDAAYDAEIILHEYTHGLTNRLVGGPADVSALTAVQSAGMGEGWSDFFALSILTKAGDDPGGGYPFGSYVAQNFDKGLRRFAYGTDMKVCPVTFADIDPVQGRFEDPTGIHKIGEIWCSALWEVRANFIERYGFDRGKREIERLVVDALKLTPTMPTMIDGRDALLLADRAANDGANQALVWRGFAKRGIGFSAVSFGSGVESVKQAFDVPPFVDGTGRIVLNDAVFADGETLRIQFGKASLVGTKQAVMRVTTTAGDSEAVTVTEKTDVPGLFEGTITVRVGQAPSVGNGVVEAQVGNDIVTAWETETDQPQIDATAKAGRRVVVFQDDLESGVGKWKPKSGWELTTLAAAGPTHSWTDSPRGEYPKNANLILVSPKFDLSTARGPKLTFNHRFDIERGFDYGFIEAKAGAGKPWTAIAAFSGTRLEFTPATVDLSAFEGVKNLKIRFRLISDGLNQRDGWYIDDVRVTGGGV